MSHLDEGTLHALLDGELELAEVREIQMHLGTCAACGSRLQDVKQFLAEADRLVGALELPVGGAQAPGVPPTHRGPPTRDEPVASAPPPAPPPQRPFRDPANWAETPPVLLLPDPLEGLERRRRWRRRAAWAAMIALVVFGGRAITNSLGPSRPELQFTERTDAPAAPTTPAVVSPEERVRPEAPVARPPRPVPAPPVNREALAKTAPAPERKARADQAARDTAPDQVDTSVAAGLAAAEDTAPADEVVAADSPTVEAGKVEQPSEEVDLATRRAASAALADLDRERLRERANAATAALPPPRAEVVETVESPPPPRTLEQRAQIYLRIGLDEAARQLGRPVHVIEAMSPEFIGLTQGRAVPGADATRPVVRVVYQDSRGRIILLDQQRLRTGQAPGAPGGSLRWALGDVMLYLHGEPGTDVLRGLQRRVR